MDDSPGNSRPHSRDKRGGKDQRKTQPSLKRERIYWIAGRMAMGEWVSRREALERQAAEWGVTLDTLKDYSAEASRLTQWASQDLEQLEVWCRQRLHQIAGQDRHDRVEAIRLLLQNVGKLTESHKHDITIDSDPDMVVQRACRSMIRDPDSRAILVDQLRLHAPELLAPELRIVTTEGHESGETPVLSAKNKPNGDEDG